MVSRFSSRRVVATALLGIGLFQASLIGAGAMQDQGTPESGSQELPPDEGEPGGFACEVIEGGTPGGVNVTVIVDDPSGESSTITIEVDRGSDDADQERSVTDSFDEESVGEDVSEAAPESGTQPESDAMPADPANDQPTQDAQEPDSSRGGVIAIDHVANSFCESAFEPAAPVAGEEDVVEDTATDGKSAPDDITQDAVTSTGYAISAGEAIEIAQSVADGELQSLVLNEDGETTVYVVTIGEREVIIDAQTGEVSPDDQQP